MSLRKRLLLILCGTFTLLWSVAAIWLLGDLRKEVERILDERLASSAHMVSGLLEQIPRPAASQSQSPINAELFGLRKGLVCQVRNLRGEVLVRTPSMVFSEPDENLLGFSRAVVDGQPWRTYTLQRHNLLITVGDKMEERAHLQRVILVAASSPVLLALVGSLFLIWLGTGRGLAPLHYLRMLLAQRKADDLTPLDAAKAPKELQPLVLTLNQLLLRLAELLQRERRFNDDAAHELRTPLTAIKTHVQLARRQESHDAELSLNKAEHSIEVMQSTIEQMLLLSRLGGDEDYSVATHATAYAVARGGLDSLIGHTGFERIQVDCCLDSDVELVIPETLAAVALRNLLDNALLYSPAGSTVGLSILDEESFVVFRVTDQGDGLDALSFEQAQQRFWRGHTSASGSGLGLAIVAAICRRFAGQLQAYKTEQGFAVELWFAKA